MTDRFVVVHTTKQPVEPATRVAIAALEGRLVAIEAAFDRPQYDPIELRRLSRTLAALRTYVDAALVRSLPRP